MTYFTNTMTSANPSADLYAVIATNLSSAGLTLVDTVVIGARTHKVWKSPAASNSLGADWYLDVAYTTTGAGNMWFTPFEAYDATNHLGIRGPVWSNPGGSSLSVPDATTYSRYGATGYALETNWLLAAGGNAPFQTPTTSFGYWISATPDRIIALSSAAPTALNYAGLFTPYATYTSNAGAAAFPLVVGITNGSAALTRVPKITTSFDWVAFSNGPSFSASQFPYPALPTFPTGDTSGVGGYLALDVPIVANNRSMILGTLKDVAIMPTVATIARGDTCTIGSDTWTLCSNATPSFLFKQV